MKLIFLLAFTVLAVVLLTLRKVGDRVRNVIIGALCFPFIFAMIIIPIANGSISRAANDAEYVTSVDNCKIYYDNNSDKYFRILSNEWNLSELHYREYLDSEIVEEYIFHQNALELIDVFDNKRGDFNG